MSEALIGIARELMANPAGKHPASVCLFTSDIQEQTMLIDYLVAHKAIPPCTAKNATVLVRICSTLPLKYAKIRTFLEDLEENMNLDVASMEYLCKVWCPEFHVTPCNVDLHLVRDLMIYADNVSNLSFSAATGQGESIRANLLKKWKKGKYDFQKSIKLFGDLAEATAKAYFKDLGERGQWFHYVNTKVRLEVATRWAEEAQASFMDGEWE